ncbi:hypothetical protein ES708_35010 [subsurface metagenome]
MDKILKQKLIEQAKETAKLNLEVCEEFKYVDGEILEDKRKDLKK